MEERTIKTSIGIDSLNQFNCDLLDSSRRPDPLKWKINSGVETLKNREGRSTYVDFGENKEKVVRLVATVNLDWCKTLIMREDQAVLVDFYAPKEDVADIHILTATEVEKYYLSLIDEKLCEHDLRMLIDFEGQELFGVTEKVLDLANHHLKKYVGLSTDKKR